MANKIELRRLNRNMVYQAVYESDGVSRQEVAARTGLSMPTVLQNLNELEEMGLVSADGVFQSTGGRRAKVLRCNYGAKYAVGIDITQNHITICIIDMAGAIALGGHREAFRYEDTPAYYDQVAGKLADILQEGGIDEDKILGVGISLPCIVDRVNNRVSYSKVIDAPEDLYKQFDSRIPYRVEIFNDANAAGYAEVWKEKSEKTCLYLMLSNSVGGSVIAPDGIYLGDNCRSAEIGHLRIHPGGKPCYCGQKGCVNAYCSAKILADQTDGKLEHFFAKVEEGDQQMKRMLDEYLHHLALCVVNLRMMYDCEIILGGYVGSCMEEYVGKLRKMVSELDPYEDGAAYVKACHYKMEASAVGAGVTFVDEYIKQI